MGITFKSNIKATQVIKYASGFNGPNDFKVFLDINSNQYVDANKTSINLNDVLTSNRLGSVSSLRSMNLIDYEVIPSNTVLRSYIPDLKTFAILTQQSTPSCLINPKYHQAWLAHTGTQVYCCYSLDGGKAYIDQNQVNVIAGDGTFENPQYFRYKNAQLVNVIREEGSGNVVCQYCPSGRIPLLPAYSQDEWGFDQLSFKPSYTPNSASGAVFVKFSEATRKLSESSAAIQLLMILQKDESTHIAVTVQSSGQIAVRYYINGAEHINYLVPGLYVDRTQANSFAISWLNGVITVSLNGKTSVLYSYTMTEAFRCNTLKLITGLTGWLGEAPNLAITDCVVYDRSLLERELTDATKR